MRSVTFQLRSVVWFFTGALAATLMAVMFLHAWRVDATSGGESTFVPTTPCRLLDTRPPGGVPFTPGETRTLDAHGFNGACNLPSDAVGLSMNVTALDATVVGTYLTVWPDGVAMPTASSLNPSPGQPPFANAVTTPLSAAGRFNVFNYSGNVNVIIDINGYYTTSTMSALQDRVAELEAKLANVEAITADGKPTVRFTGVNVQVVDGTGNSPCSIDGFENCNGLGNLIVGYNEDEGESDARSGSHNIVVGTDHDWTSYSGMVAGKRNTISGPYATATGGYGNTASNDWSSVSGGFQNTASGSASSVSGGIDNTAATSYSSVSGGADNTAGGPSSSVSGGYQNTASGFASSVSGGKENDAQGDRSSILGGDNNITTNIEASVVGGYGNTASGNNAVVSGGEGRSATGDNDWVAGGLSQDK